MNLTRFALDNARLVGLTVVLIAVAGMVLALNFPSREDPEITIREAVVTAYYPGMAPDRVENLITRQLEEAIRQVPEVETLRSSSKTGLSIIHVEVYDRFFELEPIWQNLRNKMTDVQPKLPEGTIGPIVNDDFGDVFVATIMLTSRGFSLAEMRDVARDIRDELYAVPGVERVELHGIQGERIFLETSNARLAQYGLTPTQLVQTLQTQNIILPGGYVDVGGPRIIVEPSGDFERVQDIEQVVIRIPATQHVAYLTDILTVRRAYVDPPEQLVYFNGQPAIGIAVSMMSGENILAFSPRLSAKMDELQRRLPIGYILEFGHYQADHVERSVSQVQRNVYETLTIVLVVSMLALGLRAGVVVGLHVPLTMVLAVGGMYMLDIPFHRVSLSTLIISLGMLVDSGIVIAEDFGRRLGEGIERRQAAIDTGRELALPLLTSALTTILAFLPLGLAAHVAGEYLFSMVLVMILTLLGSWGLAMGVTPLLSYQFIKSPSLSPEAAAQRYERGFYRGYRNVLDRIIRLRVPFISVTILALIGAGWLMRQVPQQFFPNSDRNQMLVYVDLPAGYGAHAVDATVRRILDWFDDEAVNPEVTRHSAYIGYGGPRFALAFNPRDQEAHVALIIVDTKTGDQVAPLVDRTRAYLLQRHPEVFPRVKQFYFGPTEPGMVEVRLSGYDGETLFSLAGRVAATMRAIPGTLELRQDWENRITKVAVRIDQTRARRAGVTSAEIASSLQSFFSGNAVTDYREGDKVIPIILRGDKAERDNLDRLRTIHVYSASQNVNVPLLQIADFEPLNQFSRVERRNLKRTITVSAKHQWLTASDLQNAILPTLRGLEAELPPGYDWEFGGESEDSTEAEAALYAYIPHCLGLIMLLLVWQFNSYLKTVIILLTIPFSFIGGVVGLYLTGSFFGFMSLLGFLSLAGIVINIAIVLLDRVQLEIDRGATPYEAVLNASVRRLRPILLSTMTTVFGLIPMMLPPDPLFFDMAIVISSGLALGTVITLGVVPVLYTLLFRVAIPRRAAT